MGCETDRKLLALLLAIPLPDTPLVAVHVYSAVLADVMSHNWRTEIMKVVSLMVTVSYETLSVRSRF